MPDYYDPYIYEAVKNSVNAQFSNVKIQLSNNQIYNNDRTPEQIQKEYQETNAKNLIEGNDYISGYRVRPPDGLTIKELVKWYQDSIIAVVGYQSELAIKLGEDPNKVGKALTQASQGLLTIATTISSAATATSVLAAVASTAVPIIGVVAGIVGILNVLGVFRGSDEKQVEINKSYNQLNVVLPFWYKEYATAYAKMEAIDQEEFKKFLKDKYGDGSTENQAPQTPVNSANIQESITEFISNYKYYIALAIAVILGYKFFKNRTQLNSRSLIRYR